MLVQDLPMAAANGAREPTFFERDSTMRRVFGLMIAVGLLGSLSGRAVFAQSSYGYDSFVYGVPSGASAWSNSGFNGVYTDRTTASFMGNEAAPLRAIAPYGQPAYGTYAVGDSLGIARTRAGVAAPGVVPAVRTVPMVQVQPRVVVRRGLFGRAPRVR